MPELQQLPPRMYQDKRWMMFVDGENLTLQGQKLIREKGLALKEGRFYKQEVFLWFTRLNGTSQLGKSPQYSHALRSYYYTSVQGAEAIMEEVRDVLWHLNFHPNVFKKTKGKKAKGVDITLTRDVLSHAFLDNYDLAVLVAGDGDYVPLVEEVKRLGKLVYVAFFKNDGLNEELRRSSDGFLDIGRFLVKDWGEHLAQKSR